MNAIVLKTNEKRMNVLLALAVMFLILFVACIPVKNAGAATIKKSGDYKYIVTSGKVKITEYTGKAKTVKIPAKLGGKKVVAIGDYAFKGNKKIRNVVLSKSVKKLSVGSFMDCTALKKVTLSKSLDTVPDQCFKGCTKLSEINLDNINAIQRGAFSNCKSIIGELDLSQTSHVDTSAFEYCTGITKVTFSDNLQVLGNFKIYEDEKYDSNLKGVESLKGHGNPFAHCTALQEFSVSTDNPNYACIDGVVYTKTDNWLIAYPSGKSGTFVVADTVAGIGDYAFSGAQISSVQLSSATKCCMDGAFEGSAITSVYIPAADDECKYSYNVFSNCNKLESVGFANKIKSLNNISFINCKALKSIKLPTEVITIPESFCRGCELLSDISTLTQIKSFQSRSFEGCKALKFSSLKDVNYIGAGAFAGCTSLTGKIDLCSVSIICKYAFADCTGITDMIISYPQNVNPTATPSGTTLMPTQAPAFRINSASSVMVAAAASSGSLTLGAADYQNIALRNKYSKEGISEYIDSDLYGNPFYGCTALKTVSVPDYSNYKSVDGVLYTSDLDRLVCYPAGRTGKCNVVYGVNVIGEGAFAGSQASEIKLPESIEFIGSKAFYNAKMTSVNIPRKVYEQVSFDNCYNLVEVICSSKKGTYRSNNGVLCYKPDDAGEKLRLLCYPSAKKGKTYNVTKKMPVCNKAFSNLKYLKKIVIPEGITNIDTIISNSKGIKLYLPKSLKKCTAANNSFFDETCKKCKVYVYKNSPMHKFAVKNGIKFKLRK